LPCPTAVFFRGRAVFLVPIFFFCGLAPGLSFCGLEGTQIPSQAAFFVNVPFFLFPFPHDVAVASISLFFLHVERFSTIPIFSCSRTRWSFPNPALRSRSRIAYPFPPCPTTVLFAGSSRRPTFLRIFYRRTRCSFPSCCGFRGSLECNTRLPAKVVIMAFWSTVFFADLELRLHTRIDRQAQIPLPCQHFTIFFPCVTSPVRVSLLSSRSFARPRRRFYLLSEVISDTRRTTFPPSRGMFSFRHHQSSSCFHNPHKNLAIEACHS